MDYKQVIKEAWALTQQNKNLMWWYAFTPEFFGILIGIFYLTYQVMSFWKSPLIRDYRGDSFVHEVFTAVTGFLADFPSLGITLIVVAAVVILVDLFLPIFCKASLTQLVARIRNGQQVRSLDGISYGFLHFLPLFEYRLVIKTFSLVGIITEAAFVLRNFGPDVFKLLFIPFLLIFGLGLLLLLLFTYSEYFIIIDGKNMISAMGSSARLVIRHWQHTILMLILMLLITVRIFLNIILVLLIPALIMLSTAALAAFALAKVGVVIGILVGVVGLYFAAYLGGILEVFSTAVWVFTFLEITKTGEVGARDLGPRDVAA